MRHQITFAIQPYLTTNQNHLPTFLSVYVTPKIPIQEKRVGTTTNGSKYRVTYKAAKWLSYQLYTYVASVVSIIKTGITK